MNRVPLERELFSAVLARVSYQIIVSDYRKNRARYEYPPAGILALSSDLFLAGFTVLSICLDEAAWYVGRNVSVLDWRTRIVLRTRRGQPFPLVERDRGVAVQPPC